MNVKSNYIITMLRSPHVNVLVLNGKVAKENCWDLAIDLQPLLPPPPVFENIKEGSYGVIIELGFPSS